MPLPQEFWDQLPEKSDKDLYDILAHGQDYLPEALAAVKEELQKRNLPAEKVLQIQAAVQSQKIAEDTRAQEPLGWGLRVLIFLFCAGFPGIFLALWYDSKGYKRKATDCWITWGVSLFAHIVLAGVLGALS
jgi:hypothetical protein